MDKKTTRASVLEIRDGMAADKHAEKCASICAFLIALLDDVQRSYENAEGEPGICYRQEPLAIAVYQSMRSEVSIDCFIEAAYGRDLTVCFPCMMRPSLQSAETGASMVFRRVSRTQYELGAVPFLDRPMRSFEPDDPALAPFPAIDASLLDMVVVPLVAFDADNNRLGYGGGNYDRLLPNLRNDATVTGIAFEEQRVDKVPCDPHDQKLPRIVTA